MTDINRCSHSKWQCAYSTKLLSSEKLTGLCTCNMNNPSIFTTICREMVFRHSKFTSSEANHRLQREPWPMARKITLPPQHYHQHNLLPSPNTSPWLWSSARQVLLTRSVAHTPPELWPSENVCSKLMWPKASVDQSLQAFIITSVTNLLCSHM